MYWIFPQPQLRFLPDFKNPCWRERLETNIDNIYENNGFAKYSNDIQKSFERIKDRWKQKGGPPVYRLRCLPYFFLAGQPKCGSTDLYKKLVAHPDIIPPPIKESHWWGKNRYGKFYICFSWFHLLTPKSSYVCVFDFSKDYGHFFQLVPYNSSMCGTFFDMDDIIP